MTMLGDIFAPFALQARLLWRFWPHLLLIGAIGLMARDLLLVLAVTIGMRFPLGGMVALSLVVLVKLLVVVAMFGVLRPGLPALAALRAPPAAAPDRRRWRQAGDRMLAVAAVSILPFFAYYAAWGFLGDTVREYSRLALDRVAFGERLRIFEFLQSGGLIAAIAACWAVRWAAKRMNDRQPASWWSLLVVAADASWIFIGLYALSVWKDAFIAWLGAGRAACTSSSSAPGSSWTKWLRDFSAYFIGGYRKRYSPVWTCLRLTLATGLGTLLAFVVAYRAIGWSGAWIWYSMTRWLGPYEFDTWQVVFGVVAVLIGSPSELNGGIALDALRITLLAAVLEYAVGAGRRDVDAPSPQAEAVR